MQRTKAGLLAALSLALCGALHTPARADDESGRVTLLEENNSLYFNSDKHYTQGLLFSYLTHPIAPTSEWNGPFHFFNGFLPVLRDDPGIARRYSLEFGQSLFTPKNIQINPPDPADRPYAGWAYLGANLLQENPNHSLERMELQLGVVGPGALGKETQNDFHALIGAHAAEGWADQIQNEPGVVLSYDRTYRYALLGDSDGIDVLPEGGITLGNVFTYGEAGGLIRIGKNLKADYGPPRVRPGMSGSDYFNGAALDGKLGFYVFAGAQGRVVGRNIFLDGNTFRESPHVDKEPLVADLEAGFTFFWSTGWRVDFMALRRTPEFVGQSHPDVLGTADMSFSW